MVVAYASVDVVHLRRNLLDDLGQLAVGGVCLSDIDPVAVGVVSCRRRGGREGRRQGKERRGEIMR